MDVAARSDSWQWGQARARLRSTTVTELVPLLVLGVVAAVWLGFSLSALAWGLGLAVVGTLIPIVLVLLPWWRSEDLKSHTEDGRSATVLTLTVGAGFEIIRLGLVVFSDLRPGDAVWLGLGVQLLSVLFTLLLCAGRAATTPTPLDEAEAAAGRAQPYSHGRGLLLFGRNTLFQVGLSVLPAVSLWLALVTVPAGAFSHILMKKSRPRAH